MLPIEREVLEDADTLVEAVIAEEQKRLKAGLDAGERKQTVYNVCDLQLVRATLQKVIYS